MIRLPEEFKEVEKQVNDEIFRLEQLIKDSSKIEETTSEGRIPPNREELKLAIFRDPVAGSKKLIVRDKGKNYTVSLTEVT